MKHEGYNLQVGNPSYQYQYSGKELQKETGWSDFGARMYMSDIARWGVIDPLAETTTRVNPYNYALDNPVMFVDPDGRKAQYLGSEYELFGVENSGIIAAFQRQGNGFGDFSSFLGDGPYFYKGAGSNGGGGSSTFGQTPAYRALMSGQTSSITNVNGYLQWTTLDKSSNTMYNDTDNIITGSTGGITINRMKVENTSWDAYKNWADWGSSAMGGGFDYVAKQRVALYNSGYWIDNLGNQRSIRYAGRAVDSQIGLRSNYLRTTAKFGKYAKGAGYVGYAINAGQIGYGVYQDRGKFGIRAQIATAGVAGGLAGAAAGAWLGAKILAPIGGAIGVAFFGVGAAPGAAIGAAVGSLVGGIVGGVYGGDYAEGLASDILN